MNYNSVQDNLFITVLILIVLMITLSLALIHCADFNDDHTTSKIIHNRNQSYECKSVFHESFSAFNFSIRSKGFKSGPSLKYLLETHSKFKGQTQQQTKLVREPLQLPFSQSRNPRQGNLAKSELSEKLSMSEKSSKDVYEPLFKIKVKSISHYMAHQ